MHLKGENINLNEDLEFCQGAASSAALVGQGEVTHSFTV